MLTGASCGQVTPVLRGGPDCPLGDAPLEPRLVSDNFLKRIGWFDEKLRSLYNLNAFYGGRECTALFGFEHRLAVYLLDDPDELLAEVEFPQVLKHLPPSSR